MSGHSHHHQHDDYGRAFAIGIALKIADGSMGRGRNPVILRTLEQLGLDLKSRPGVQRYRDWPLRNVVGDLVGEVRAEFDLEFL